jgi:hypothetical protein
MLETSARLLRLLSLLQARPRVRLHAPISEEIRRALAG